jgi:hypothetical protein
VIAVGLRSGDAGAGLAKSRSLVCPMMNRYSGPHRDMILTINQIVEKWQVLSDSEV